MNNVVELEEIEKSYGDLKVLKDITLSVEEGEIFGILGPNGVGKTTLFQTVIGLIRHDAGTIKIQGKLHDHSKETKAKIGYLSADVNFYENRTAEENLEFFADLAEKKTDLDEFLELVDLKDEADKKVKGFSTGMKKRLGIAQSLIKDPEIIIYDEPTTGLDPQGKKEFKDLIRKINREKDKTIILSSHATTEVESLCDRFAVLKDGVVMACGTKEELSSSNSSYKLLLKTENNDKTEKILEEKNLDFKRKDGCLLIKTERDIRNNLFETLVKKNITISKLEIEEETLESAYLKLTSD